MKDYIKFMDGLSDIVKLILCLPALDILWSVYRLFKSARKDNLLGIVLAILTVVPGATFFWLIDIVCMILNKKIYWID